jgi:hypothetical protein
MITIVHPETASFGPERRFCDFFKASTAQAHFCNPQDSVTMPAGAKMLKPCSEPKSTVSGWTIIKSLCNFDFDISRYKLKLCIRNNN